jgi:hypothetical protein
MFITHLQKGRRTRKPEGYCPVFPDERVGVTDDPERIAVPPFLDTL